MLSLTDMELCLTAVPTQNGLDVSGCFSLQWDPSLFSHDRLLIVLGGGFFGVISFLLKYK